MQKQEITNKDQFEYKPIFNKKDETYTSHYCEENIYLLCKKFNDLIKKQDLIEKDENVKNEGFAVFVTNSSQQVLICYQKLGDTYPQFNKLVVWDYHVIFVHKQTLFNYPEQNKKTVRSYVYDFDSTLDFPTEFNEYFDKSLGFKKPIQFEQTLLRPVSVEIMLKKFASDRRHMLSKDKKSSEKYFKPLPNYPDIVNEKGEVFNLMDFLKTDNMDMEFGLPYFKEQQFNEYFKYKLLDHKN